MTAAILAACAIAPAAAKAADLAGPAASCLEAGFEAERQYGLPSGLMAAIGQTESGRYDPTTGRVAAWPWTINASGRGYHFSDRSEAIRVVQEFALRGIRSIDVGCYQVNLMYHPTAFTSLEQAFEPMANALYAARFLATLQARSGSWESAIAAYHSATPAAGSAYRNRVLAAWSGAPPSRPGAASAGITIPVVAQLAPVGRGIPPGGRTVSLAETPSAWTVAAQTMGIRVWTPGNAQAGKAAQAPLPRVISGRP